MSFRGFVHHLFGALLLVTVCGSLADARVVRFVIEQRRVFAEGMEFGSVGPYERLDGTAYMEVDPDDPLNAVIVNIDKAPRNGRGFVEFSTTFYMLKPMDVSRGNGKIFYGINNRGNKLESGLRWHHVPASNNPITAAHAGDGFLMRLGYTVVDAGWQGDVAEGNDRLFPDLPIATESDGRPIVAPIRVEFSDRSIPKDGTFTLNLKGSQRFRPYPTADLNQTESSLTVRTEVEGGKTLIPSANWAFGRCPLGRSSLEASETDVCLFGGFRSDRLYELIYPAKNPIVMGLGYAITRDLASFLRYSTKDDEGNPNPLVRNVTEVGIRRAYGSGSSSTGMYLRDFLYLGFNEDEEHRRVFDAINIHIPGSHRLFANVAFADPNTYSRQDDRHHFLSTSYPPMQFAVVTDPLTGIRDGILKRPATDPLVFQVDTENEFYTMKASLNVHDGIGRPVFVPDNVRLYLLSNFQHAGGNPNLAVPGSNDLCANPTNPNYHGPTHRALITALDAWADRGQAPPPSRYPQVGDGTLVSIDQYAADFPQIPGTAITKVVNELSLVDFGPWFGSTGGFLTRIQPSLGPEYTVLVPIADEDGLNPVGIRPVEVRVPLGTNLGWNVRADGRRVGNLCGLTGSFIPFTKTEAEREILGDPRLSLEERYTNHQGYVEAVRHATSDLVRERFLLAEDAERFIQQAETGDVLR
jgi:hypothetical protein